MWSLWTRCGKGWTRASGAQWGRRRLSFSFSSGTFRFAAGAEQNALALAQPNRPASSSSSSFCYCCCCCPVVVVVVAVAVAVPWCWYCPRRRRFWPSDHTFPCSDIDIVLWTIFPPSFPSPPPGTPSSSDRSPCVVVAVSRWYFYERMLPNLTITDTHIPGNLLLSYFLILSTARQDSLFWYKPLSRPPPPTPSPLALPLDLPPMHAMIADTDKNTIWVRNCGNWQSECVCVYVCECIHMAFTHSQRGASTIHLWMLWLLQITNHSSKCFSSIYIDAGSIRCESVWVFVSVGRLHMLCTGLSCK